MVMRDGPGGDGDGDHQDAGPHRDRRRSAGLDRLVDTRSSDVSPTAGTGMKPLVRLLISV